MSKKDIDAPPSYWVHRVGLITIALAVLFLMKGVLSCGSA
jgi:hypothetical protein